MRVLVVGAGFGGIAAAVNLTKSGIDFEVVEQASGAGGVWFSNRYPGCGVDTDSRVYSFSFIPYAWTRNFAAQSEVQRYAEAVIDHFGIRDRFVFNTRVSSCEWDGVSSTWTVTTADGETKQADVLIGAVGLFNVPNVPNWPGMKTYEGELLHTARWKMGADLTGKRVAVVGTGATAAQLVPAIAGTVKHLTLYQREPGWILPRIDQVYDGPERWKLARGGWGIRVQRWRAFYRLQRYLVALSVGSRPQRSLQKQCTTLIEESLPDARLREIVTPSYPFGCKRPIRTSDFYPALLRPNVDLVPNAVSAATPKGLIDTEGVEREFDAVILATGFRTADFLKSLPVTGESGQTLRETWGQSPAAYLGTTVPGFPNFFIMYGPNTNGGGPITAQLERQAEMITRVLMRMQRKGADRVDTEPGSLRRFVSWVDRQNQQQRSAMESGCHNYYFSESGRNVTQWPLSHLRFMAMTRWAGRFGFTLGRSAKSVTAGADAG